MTPIQKDFLTTLLFNMQLMSDNNSVLASILDKCELHDDRYYIYQGDDIKVYDYMTDKLKCYVQANGGGFILTKDAAKIVNKAVQLMEDYGRPEHEIEKVLSNMEVDPRYYNGLIVYANFTINNHKNIILECYNQQASIILKSIPEYFNIDTEVFNGYKKQYGQQNHI